MKKMKLLSFVLSGILAVSSMCGITASASDLYEIPEGISTISELKDYITEPVEISAEDWGRLLANEKDCGVLFNFYLENGADEQEATTLCELYFQGLAQIIAEGHDYPYTIYPTGQEPEFIPYYTPQPEPFVPLAETSGTFESGVTYFYNEETKGLVFDGKGKLTKEEYFKAHRSFSNPNLEYIFFGKDVELMPDEQTGKIHVFGDAETVYFDYCDKKIPWIPMFTYESSNFAKTFEEYIPQEQIEKGNYVYYTVEDGTDPYTFVNPLEPLPEQISTKGRIGSDDENDVTYAKWWFDGTDEMGTFEIRVSSVTTELFDMNDILEITKDYSITKVYITSSIDNMNKLPAELQGFETIEEAEAELLRLINEAKAEEQPTEETTEATVPTEVAEPTEAVEEKTAETVAEAVELLADEITEDKTEITLGDVNGNGNVDVRDCSFIAREIAGGKAADLPDSADYNKDGVKNIRDAATLAKELA